MSDPRELLPGLLDAAQALAAHDWESAEAPAALEALEGLATAARLIDAALMGAAEQCEASDATAGTGWASTKDYLTHLLGGHLGAGASYVRLADNTRALRAVRVALANGEISAAQARVIGKRIRTLPFDDALRQAAAEVMVRQVRENGLNATDLDRGFSGVLDELDPDRRRVRDDLERERNERGAHHARFLSFKEDGVGGVRIRGYATVEEVELLKSCLLPLAAPQVSEPGACGGMPARSDVPRLRDRGDDGQLTSAGCPDPRCHHDGRDPREPGARLWDAAMEICRRLQAAGDLPMSHGTAARVIVTVPLDDLQGRLGGRGVLPSGDTLSVTAVRRLACDADVIPAVLGSHGEVLDVGRSQRLVTPGIWTALVVRDGHCVFPGCARGPIACDAHHIVHWSDGGSTSLDNLVLLCRHHHSTVHHTPWTVRIDPVTGKPCWVPPPRVDDRGRFTYRQADGPGRQDTAGSAPEVA